MENGVSEDITTMRLKIEGHVQGIGYREFAVREGNTRGLKGWVRNRADGTVEALASGPSKLVEEFITLCLRGPEAARVENIELKPAEPPETMGFVRKPTV
jgi:acylphosphatase